LTEAKRTRELLANCKSLEEDGAGHSASVADMRKLARAFIADIEAAEPAQPKPAEPPALTSEILKTKLAHAGCTMGALGNAVLDHLRQTQCHEPWRHGRLPSKRSISRPPPPARCRRSGRWWRLGLTSTPVLRG
jgi:hypothetical protein